MLELLLSCRLWSRLRRWRRRRNDWRRYGRRCLEVCECLCARFGFLLANGLQLFSRLRVRGGASPCLLVGHLLGLLSQLRRRCGLGDRRGCSGCSGCGLRRWRRCLRLGECPCSFLSLLLSPIVKMIADLCVCCGFRHRFCLSLLTLRRHAFLSLFLS